MSMLRDYCAGPSCHTVELRPSLGEADTEDCPLSGQGPARLLSRVFLWGLLANSWSTSVKHFSLWWTGRYHWFV